MLGADETDIRCWLTFDGSVVLKWMLEDIGWECAV